MRPFFFEVRLYHLRHIFLFQTQTRKTWGVAFGTQNSSIEKGIWCWHWDHFCPTGIRWLFLGSTAKPLRFTKVPPLKDRGRGLGLRSLTQRYMTHLEGWWLEENDDIDVRLSSKEIKRMYTVIIYYSNSFVQKMLSGYTFISSIYMYLRTTTWSYESWGWHSNCLNMRSVHSHSGSTSRYAWCGPESWYEIVRLRGGTFEVSDL